MSRQMVIARIGRLTILNSSSVSGQNLIIIILLINLAGVSEGETAGREAVSQRVRSGMDGVTD